MLSEGRFPLLASVAACLMLICAGGTARAQAPSVNVAQEFREVFDIVRTNLHGVTGDELNRAALAGLL